MKSLRRIGVVLIFNKRVWNAVLGCNLKNDRMISVHFQSKPFNIIIIQVNDPTTNAEEAEVEWFYEDIQDFLKKDALLITGDWNTKVGSQTIPGITESLVLELKMSRAKANRVLPRKCTSHSKHPLPTTQEMTLHMDITKMVNTEIRLIIFFAAEDGEALYSQEK